MGRVLGGAGLPDVGAAESVLGMLRTLRDYAIAKYQGSTVLKREMQLGGAFPLPMQTVGAESVVSLITQCLSISLAASKCSISGDTLSWYKVRLQIHPEPRKLPLLAVALTLISHP